MLAEDVHPGLIAEAVGHLGRAFDVAEHDRDGAVGRGVRLEVWVLRLDGRGDAVDRSVHIAGLNPLRGELVGEDHFEVSLRAEPLVDRCRLVEQLERLLAVALIAPRQVHPRAFVQSVRLIPRHAVLTGDCQGPLERLLGLTPSSLRAQDYAVSQRQKPGDSGPTVAFFDDATAYLQLLICRV